MSPTQKKVLVIFGTRPEAIKLVPVITELHNRVDISTHICVTAQHRSMLDQVLNLFNIIPDYDLNLMQAGQDLTDINVKILLSLRDVLRQLRPDWVLVQGDTTTTFAACLTAFYEKIPVAHVEAGLRTDNIYSPWPEELNRRLVSHIASLHFAPTQTAAKYLLKENIDKDKILVTGNTVIDALLMTITRIKKEADLTNKLDNKFNYLDNKTKLVLVTGHRRESFGEGFKQICYGLRNIAERKDVQIVYPVHLNPNVQKSVKEILGGIKNIFLIEPLDYLSFVYLMDKSYLILTDSGGIQEEAPSLGKPVLVMRDTTERPEAVTAGTAKLVGANRIAIAKEVNRLLNDSVAYKKMSKIHNPFGDGNASQRIVKRLIHA